MAARATIAATAAATSPLASPTWSPIARGSTPPAFTRSPDVPRRRAVAAPHARSPMTPRKTPLPPTVPMLVDDDGAPDVFDAHGFLPNGHDGGVTWAQWARWHAAWQRGLAAPAALERVARWERQLDAAGVRRRCEGAFAFKPGHYEADGGLLISHYDGASQEALWTITQDIPRTYATHALFLSPESVAAAPPGAAELLGAGRRSLHHVLASYAALNPAVGYCQGMSYVAAALLTLMSEESAFWVLVALLDSPRHLRDFYDPNLSGLLLMGQMYDRLLAERMPDVAKHLTDAGLHHLVYVTPWFMRLFSSLESWPLFLHVLDDVVAEGHARLLQAALGTMHILRDELLAAQGMNELLPLLQSRANQLVQVERLQHAMQQHPVSWADVLRHKRDVHAAEAQATPTFSRKRAREAAVLATPITRKRLAAGPATPSFFARMFSVLATPTAAAASTSTTPRPAPTPAAAPETLVGSPSAELGSFVTSPTSAQAFREFATPRARAQSRLSRTPRRRAVGAAEPHAPATPNTPLERELL
eukprot:Unigene11678_Nuclearia_a/m.35579 Unigene11678_Nuclearia_a/g.35579  ORF Unigene11678_Nuclearia_a/g.35579 Unigene11678_Nuclearia_a/m.35579 type:complete len:533 (-) Unigene11678_Nuclearia_a:59-1657(-)